MVTTPDKLPRGKQKHAHFLLEVSRPHKIFCFSLVYYAWVTSNYLKSLPRISVNVANGSHVFDTHD